MKKHLKHLGSTLALIFGVLTFFSAFAPSAELEPNFNLDKMILGVIMILGALAYRSAKKRKLGQVKDSQSRKFNEIGKIIIVCAAVLLRNDLKFLVATKPFEIVIIPLWALIAYLIIVLKPQKATEGTTSSDNHD